ncbi:MAG: hypothetical protein WC935_00050 [Thermoleophilia bacterium]
MIPKIAEFVANCFNAAEVAGESNHKWMAVAAVSALEARIEALEEVAQLRRSVIIYDDPKFIGRWVAVPEEDFDALRAALKGEAMNLQTIKDRLALPGTYEVMLTEVDWLVARIEALGKFRKAAESYMELESDLGPHASETTLALMRLDEARAALKEKPAAQQVAETDNAGHPRSVHHPIEKLCMFSGCRCKGPAAQLVGRSPGGERWMTTGQRLRATVRSRM